MEEYKESYTVSIVISVKGKHTFAHPVYINCFNFPFYKGYNFIKREGKTFPILFYFVCVCVLSLCQMVLEQTQGRILSLLMVTPVVQLVLTFFFNIFSRGLQHLNCHALSEASRIASIRAHEYDHYSAKFSPYLNILDMRLYGNLPTLAKSMNLRGKRYSTRQVWSVCSIWSLRWKPKASIR